MAPYTLLPCFFLIKTICVLLYFLSLQARLNIGKYINLTFLEESVWCFGLILSGFYVSVCADGNEKWGLGRTGL